MSHMWMKCKGCDGEIGVPSDWSEDQIKCPQCGATFQLKGKLLYRSPLQDDESPPQAVVHAGIRATPSLDLLRKSQSAMAWGIAAVVLGWTFIVPFCGLLEYSEASKMAKQEQVEVPGKATLGLVLCLLFGAAQGIAVIAHFAK